MILNDKTTLHPVFTGLVTLGDALVQLEIAGSRRRARDIRQRERKLEYFGVTLDHAITGAADIVSRASDLQARVAEVVNSPATSARDDRRVREVLVIVRDRGIGLAIIGKDVNDGSVDGNQFVRVLEIDHLGYPDLMRD